MAEGNGVTTEEQTELTLEQRQRAEALAVARAVLIDSRSTPLSGSEGLPKRFGTQDLIDVALWVLDGTDPLEAYRRTSDGDDASVGVTSESTWERIDVDAAIAEAEDEG